MKRRLFEFPDPVNEYAARTVAAGVLLMAIAYLATQWSWILIVLAYGFVARVASGPRFSPLGQLATRVIVPRLPLEPKPTPGPPKRFAQGIGATFTIAAVVARFGFGAVGVSMVLAGFMVVAAGLESIVGYCLGCKAFALLMKAGVIPETVCEACADLSRRRPGADQQLASR
jgi:hypothetical protein